MPASADTSPTAPTGRLGSEIIEGRTVTGGATSSVPLNTSIGTALTGAAHWGVNQIAQQNGGGAEVNAVGVGLGLLCQVLRYLPQKVNHPVIIIMILVAIGTCIGLLIYQGDLVKALLNCGFLSASAAEAQFRSLRATGLGLAVSDPD